MSNPALIVKRFPLLRRLNRILVSVVTVTIFLGVMIVPFEIQHSDGHILTIFDGLWWAITTITTVGYGDLVPVTVPGRIIAMALQIAGVVMFGSLIGTLTAYLNRANDEYHWRRIQDRLESNEEELKAIKNKLDYLIKNKEPKKKPTRWGL